MEVFSKELTKTDVGVRLSFPMKVLHDFEFPEGKDKMEFEVTDSSGKSWNFGLSKRNEARHSHPKPVLSSGWRAYVQAKGLKVKDRVLLLYVQEDKLVTKTRFKIRAQRKVVFVPFKLFGKGMKLEQWVDIEEIDSIPCSNIALPHPQCLTHDKLVCEV
ncbi:hypothetical protein PTKIN_Ptkin02bG0187100 [Pterospermum kingtungense]